MADNDGAIMIGLGPAGFAKFDKIRTVHRQINIETEAGKLVHGWALNDANDPHAREALESRIISLVTRVQDEQREADAVKCDEIATRYSKGTFNDCSREVRAAEDCASEIREGEEVRGK